MSKIDERIARLQFDNKDFEKNIKTSSESLAKFDSELERSGKGTAFSGLSGAVEGIANKFSSLGTIATGALFEIGRQAVQVGQQLVESLAIAPIAQGFDEYELKVNSIRTILASGRTSEGLPVTLEMVNKELEALNQYADRTIYSFSDMTSSIGKFTNAGVALPDAVAAIQGISNAAALSGANANQASHAMYNFGQAISSGFVKLIDWKSIELANMATVEFKEQLLDAGVAAGTLRKDAEGMYMVLTKNGKGESLNEVISTTTRFNESLAFQWLTTEVLTDTLGDYADETTEIGKRAFEAAQTVRTFSQAMDTAKEAAGSGWATTFELIFGDFNEATNVWTGFSNLLTGIIQDSAQARNAMLSDWAKLGGRTNLFEGIKAAWEDILSVLKPVQEAFRNVFPPATAQMLADFTKAFRDFFVNFDVSQDVIDGIRIAFEGFFSVIKLGWEALKFVVSTLGSLLSLLAPLGVQILGVTSSIGEFFINLRKAAEESDFFGTLLTNIQTGIQDFVTRLKEFGNSISDALGLDSFVTNLKNAFNDLPTNGNALDNIGESFRNFSTNVKEFFQPAVEFVIEAFQKLKTFLEPVTRIIVGAFNTMKDSLVGTWEAEGLEGILTLINTFLTGGILVGIKKLVDTFKEIGGSTSGMLEGITGVFTGLQGVLKSYQDTLKAEVLKTIAVSIAILAASLIALSLIDPNKLQNGAIAMGVLFTELMLGMKMLHVKDVGNIVGVSAALILLGGALLEITGVVAILGAINKETLIQGLVGLGAIMLEIGIFSQIISKGVNPATMAASAIAIGALGLTLLELTGVVAILGNLSNETLVKGLAAMGAALLEMTVTLKVLADPKVLAGAAAIAVVAASLLLIAPAFALLGALPIENIAIALGAIAGIFIVFGAAAALLTPVAPTLVALGAGIALLGVAVLAIGAGLALFAAGLAALVAVGTVGALAAAGAITVLAATIPTVMTKIGEGIIALFETLTAGIPKIAEFLVTLLTTLTTMLTEHIPQFVQVVTTFILEMLQHLAENIGPITDAVFDVILGFINAVADRLPELIDAGARLFTALFEGIAKALEGANLESLFTSVIMVKILTSLVAPLTTVGPMIGPAMAGLLGIGALLAELTAILAVIGAIAQIPGLKWLVGEGGGLLEEVGRALGRFVGGIVGGVMEGVTSSFPTIANDLSQFMTNIQPFIEGAKNLDSNVLGSISSLVGAILALTAANVIEGLTSWLTGGTSMVKFGEELAEFGPYFMAYYEAVKDIKPVVITASANAAKALSEMAANLPRDGGVVGWFLGENSLVKFAEELIPFGKAIVTYSNEVADLKPEVVVNSMTAAKAVAEFANNIPNTGGILSEFTGDNTLSQFAADLVPFGYSLKLYGDNIANLESDVVVNSINAAKTIAEFANNLPNQGGFASWFSGDNTLSTFGAELAAFGPHLAAYSASVTDVKPEVVTASANAAKVLADFAAVLPDQGGVASWFSGDNGLAAFGEELVKFGAAFYKFYLEIENVEMGKLNNAIDQMSRIVKLAEALAATDASAMGNFAKGFESIGKSGIDAFIKAFTDASPRVRQAALDILEVFNSGVREATPKVESNISTVADAFLTKFRDKFGLGGGGFSSNSTVMYEHGKTILQSMITAIDELAPTAVSNIQQIAIDMLKMLTDQVSNWVTVGEDIVQGLARGITNSADTAVRAVQNLVKKALDRAKSDLGIKSPSRVFEQIGQFCTEGFAVGVSEYSGLVDDTIGGLKNSALTKIDGVISEIKHAFEADLDQNPVITPVLDMNNLRTGFEETSAMFQDGASYNSAIALNRAFAQNRAEEVGLQNGSMSPIVNNFSMPGMVVRSDADIEMISRKLFQKQQQAQRSKGVRVAYSQ